MPAKFYLSTKLDNKGEATIRVSLYVRGVRFESSASCKIPPSKWEGKKGRVRKGSSNAKGQTYLTINKHLARIEELCANIETRYLGTSSRPSRGELKKAFLELFKPSSSEEENDKERAEKIAVAYMIEGGGVNKWAEKTRLLKGGFFKQLKAWKPDLYLEDLGEAEAIKFAEWRQKRGCTHRTINADLKVMKTFLLWADDKGYKLAPDFKKIRPFLKTLPKEVIYLTEEELMRLYAYNVPPDGARVRLTNEQGRGYEKVVRKSREMECAKDLFCFCCFSGLRFSDMQGLTQGRVSADEITIITKKTSDAITIPIAAPAREILEKYKPQTALNRGYALPRMSVHTLNALIKEVCELCEINTLVSTAHLRGGARQEITQPKYKYISSHAGRRTFICYALHRGLTAEAIMKISGHKTFEAMRPYIDITDQAKRKVVSVFDKFSR